MGSSRDGRGADEHISGKDTQTPPQRGNPEFETATTHNARHQPRFEFSMPLRECAQTWWDRHCEMWRFSGRM